MSQKSLDKVHKCIAEAKKVIFGQDELIEAIIMSLVCEGHLLIEGMPGLGKTLSVSLMAKLCDLSFKRIQFTPDLLPSDLVGTMIFNNQKNEFSTKFGPIFTQILLADEINRSPAKVQSALLEAMAEKQVTIGDNTHGLTSPFVVLATQNPIEQEGTYSLPEAQLDRFMMKVNVDYPSFEQERKILELSLTPLDNKKPILSTDDLLEMQDTVSKIYVDDKIKDIITKICTATRPGNKNFDKKYEGLILAGVSPRAGIWLYRCGKFNAFLDNRDFVTPDDLLKSVASILSHRIILTYEAIIDQKNAKELSIEISRDLIK